MIGYVQKQLSRFSLMTNRFGGEIYNLSRCSGSNCSPPRRKSSAGMQTTDWAEPKPQKQADELVFTSIRLAANTSQCSHRHVGADRIWFWFFFSKSHIHTRLCCTCGCLRCLLPAIVLGECQCLQVIMENERESVLTEHLYWTGGIPRAVQYDCAGALSFIHGSASQVFLTLICGKSRHHETQACAAALTRRWQLSSLWSPGETSASWGTKQTAEHSNRPSLSDWSLWYESKWKQSQAVLGGKSGRRHTHQ